MIEILRYQGGDGREPFSEWLNSLRDKAAQARIRMRLRQMEAGNLGDCKAVGHGVSELRVHVGAGYRVYFGRFGTAVIVLLAGGDKDSQEKDIQRATELWLDWKRRQT